MIFDALVVGGGPAGCAAAALLTRDGATVAVVQHRAANQRRSESLPAAAARALVAAGLGPVDDLVEGRCGGMLSAWGSEQLMATDGFASPDGPGWWVDRDRFDAALRRRCAQLGVTVITGRVGSLQRAGRAWVARSATVPELYARWVIDASGRAAVVGRRLSAARRAGPPLLAVQARTIGARNPALTRVLVEAEPDGWWYVGASSRHRISAVALAEPGGGRLLRRREHFVNRLGALPNLGRFAGTAADWSTPQVSPAGGVSLDPVCGDGWIACGDAALAVDPLSAQGLLGALASGVAAGRAILRGDTSAALAEIVQRHDQVLATYESRRAAAYALERRWPSHPFWSRQRHPAQVPVSAGCAR